MKWSAPQIWKDQECWIIAGGPSVPRQFGVPENIIRDVMSGKKLSYVYSSYLESIHQKHVIGVNNAYRIGPWIDVLFFGDCAWYLVHRIEIAKFPGLKVTCCNRFENKKKEDSEGIKYLAKDKEKRQGISFNSSKVSWNSNSGSASISLACHFGVKRIILLGFDMRLDGNSVSHWHGSHGNPKRVPPFNRHLRGFPEIAQDAGARGVEIINASPESAINNFSKIKVEDLLK